MTLLGAPELLALHGADVPGGIVIALGDDAAGGAPPPVASPAAAAAPAPDVVWRATPGDGAPGVRTVAPGGEGLWRRAVLPAADTLFALPPGGAGVLVAGGAPEARDAAVAALAASGVDAVQAAVPSPEQLAAAAVVAVCGTPGEPLPSLAPAVPAAGRILVAPRAEPAFGFAAGVDHLAYGDPDELARLSVAAARDPSAFALVCRSARVAAEAHRASVVFARLAADLVG